MLEEQRLQQTYSLADEPASGLSGVVKTFKNPIA
jgi:hypothetical protein